MTTREETVPTIILEVQDSLKTVPLLEAAIHRQIAYVAMGIDKTRKRIDAFEQKYGCRLEDVDKTVPVLDPLERVEWEGEAEMLQRLEAEQKLLETVRVCE
jgi:type III secretory pathway component EscV